MVKEDKNLYVSELGEVVNSMMKDAFSSIVDVNFTANLEALLDKVEDGAMSLLPAYLPLPSPRLPPCRRS